MAKPKRQEQIEKLIYRGHRAGVCDMEGNSVDSYDKTPTARPINMRPTLRIRFVAGVRQVNRGDGWKAERYEGS